jgi:transcriptional regulator with XRE-family HTH domain
MSLAQRVRDCRYSKGWGPDELASRAAISRTALYQIESGKTELPRAGTLRRIALALDVSMDALLGHTENGHVAPPAAAPSLAPGVSPHTRTRLVADWFPAEGAPLNGKGVRQNGKYETTEAGRFGVDLSSSRDVGGIVRERELVLKFHELLSSPFAESMARIVEETHRLIPQPRVASAYD